MNRESAPATNEDSKVAPPQFQQNDARQFKSKAPKAGKKRYDDLPGMESLGDAAVICPWEDFGDIELSDLAQFGII
ncbi:retinal cone rhodopsin-sensitive cGMP 3',5'-cyclic phosphodiesterase subunit gamma-like [Pempheris klunzingeri]|uniref:retinal cone rhodopsin-sensitive cGMP 3',5'-cyclic phosphodiesterase subunit gamma-like n=1 Tax=Pempheris klunzingeri TaxID=3127111 RepID=UPI0039804CF6